jgi:hypothetical protein
MAGFFKDRKVKYVMAYCELHPWVEEMYPCSVCLSQQTEREYYASIESEHYAEMEKEYLAYLEKEYIECHVENCDGDGI